MSTRRPLLLVHAAMCGAVLSACSPAPVAPPPSILPTAPTAIAAPEPPAPPEFVPMDAFFSWRADAHRWAPNGEVVAIEDELRRVLLWDAAAGAPRGRFGPFPERATAIAWSRDGERIAIRAGQRAHVFALRDGAPLGTFEAASEGDPMMLSPDGKALHFLSASGVLVTQDAATGAEIGRVKLDLPASAKVAALALAPDGARIALALEGGGAPRIGVWSVGDGSRLALFDEKAGDVTWAEDGASIYLHPAGAKTASVRVAVGSAPEKLPAPVPLPGLPRFSVNANDAGHGTTIFSAGGARLPGPFADEEAAMPLGAAVSRVRFNPDATELLASRLSGVDRWDLRTGRLLSSLPLAPEYISANARHLLVTAPGDGARVQLVDATTGQPRLTVVSTIRERGLYGRFDHADAARRLVVIGVPDGPRPAKWPGVAGAVRDPEAELVTLVDPESGAVERVIGGAGSKITQVNLCAEGKLVITAHERGKDGRAPLRVWSAADGKRRLDAAEGALQACSDDAAVVVVRVRVDEKKPDAKKAKGRKEPSGAKKPPAPPKYRLDFYDARTQRRLSSIDVSSERPSFYLSPDGSLAALLGRDEPEVVIWDIRAGKRRATLPGKAHDGFAAWSPSGKKLAVKPDGGNVSVWDAGTGAVQPLAGNGQLFCHNLRWSSDDKRLLVVRGGKSSRAVVEIFGERGERLDQPGRTFGIPYYRPALLVVDEPDGTRTHHELFGSTRLGTEVKGSILMSWPSEDAMIDPFVWMETSKDGRFAAVAPFGAPAVFRVEDGASIVLHPVIAGGRRVGVATSADGHFTGDPEAFGRVTFRRGHWLRGQLLTGREVSDYHAPSLLTELFAGRLPAAPQNDKR